jgi:hypothetical protein
VVVLVVVVVVDLVPWVLMVMAVVEVGAEFALVEPVVVAFVPCSQLTAAQEWWNSTEAIDGSSLQYPLSAPSHSPFVPI